MPKPLHFKPTSVEAILRGVERLTIRRADSGYSRGDRVKAVVRPNPAFAELEIVKVETIELEDLTRAHLRRSGLKEMEALRDSARRVYPDENEFDVISFECCGELT